MLIPGSNLFEVSGTRGQTRVVIMAGEQRREHCSAVVAGHFKPGSS